MAALTIRSLLLGLLYWGAVHVGLLFFEDKISILWPANGIALAFFISATRRDWPYLGLAVAVGYFMGLTHVTAQPLAVKAGFLLANYIEIVPAAYFIRRAFDRGIRPETSIGVLYFLAFGVVIGPLCGSLVATFVAMAGFGQAFSLTIWAGWGFGNAVSTLAVTLPIYFLISMGGYKTRIDWSRENVIFAVELTTLAAVTFLVLHFNFVLINAPSLYNGAIHVLFLLALWAALRFSVQVVSLWLFTVVMYAASYTLMGQGPFIIVSQEFPTAVFYLHTFSFTLCMTGLLLNGVMTDRRNIETSLRIANNAKSEFLSSMSHELRTPLNAIIGFSDMTKGLKVTPENAKRIHEYAGDINQSGLHLLSLINDILDLAKIETGNDELQEKTLDMRAISRLVANMVRQQAIKGGVALDLQIEDGLEMLRADDRKIRQILLNLLSNAIKFTNSGGKVTLRIWSSTENGFAIQVSDTGIGIAPDDISKAFSQFGQVDSSLSRKYQGTGLGLPLTKALVELHDGVLDLQSEVGVGTTITVRFPASRMVSRARVGGITGPDYSEASQEVPAKPL